MPIVTGSMEDMSEKVRVFRQRKKNLEPTCCPVCSITLRDSEMANHLSLELDRLNKLTGSSRNRKSNGGGCVSPVTNGAKDTPSTSTDAKGTALFDPTSWKTYVSIRNNRRARMKIPRKRRADDPECPICNERITYDIDTHVEACLKSVERKHRNTTASESVFDPEDDTVDIEGDVYEWAGQTRVRATSLLEQGYIGMLGSCSSTGGASILNSFRDSTLKAASTQPDEDDELNVDGDDTQVYGPAQYSECNVIVSASGDNLKEQTENTYLRNLIIGQQDSTNNAALRRTDDEEECEDDNNGCNDDAFTNCLMTDETNDAVFVEGRDQTIESLKAKIREYETRVNKNDSLKCLICMDEFKLPVVSICCWHVHCEKCWLKTLGARKLCPQCNMITSPSDLRRVYM